MYTAIKKRLLNPRTVMVQLSLFLGAVLLAVLLPQQGFYSPAAFSRFQHNHPHSYQLIQTLQLDRIVTAPWFLGLAFLLALSLLLSTIDQLVRAWRNTWGLGKKKARGHCLLEMAIAKGSWQMALRPLDLFLQFHGFRTTRPLTASPMTDQWWCYSKHLIGYWGGAFFHAGLLVLLVAAAYGAAFYQRGFVPIIEGETVRGEAPGWTVQSKGPAVGDLELSFDIFLNRFTPTYFDNDQEQQLTSELLIAVSGRNQPLKKMLSISRPLHLDGTTLYQSGNFGYALTFALAQPGQTDATITHFILEASGDRRQPLRGRSTLTGTGYTILLSFRPDQKNPSFFLGMPEVRVRIQGQDGSTLLSNKLSLQDSMVLPDQQLLQFVDVRYWSGILAVKGYAMPAVYFGFLLVTIGAFLLYCLAPQTIMVHLDNKTKTTLRIYHNTPRRNRVRRPDLTQIIALLPERPNDSEIPPTNVTV